MAEIEVNLATRIDTQIDQLVEQDEFLSRQEAIEELLTAGLQTYNTGASVEEDGDLAFADEMTNPGEKPMGTEEDDPGNDEYTF